MASYIHANLPVNVTVIQPHPLSGDSQGHETVFLLVMKPAAMTHTECSNRHPYLYIHMNEFHCIQGKRWSKQIELVFDYY